MATHEIKLPDVGEGVAEAELTEWLVKVGDVVKEDDPLASVMTDKATVEIPAPVDGKITWLGPEIGDQVAVGTAIIRLETDGATSEEGDVEPAPNPEPAPPPTADTSPDKAPKPDPVEVSQPKDRLVLAAPAVRKRARDMGIDLTRIQGSGPDGRVLHEDLTGASAPSASPQTPTAASKEGFTDIPIVGLRRKIAEKMATSKSHIVHITYVDEVDMTELEALRAKLNAKGREGQPKLTLLPFLALALCRAIAEQPLMNAHFDDRAGSVRQYDDVHLGIAAQTDAGLVVPVVKAANTLSLWDLAREIERLATGARAGTLTREELTGSTITITSLGKLGGIVTTPIINHPEVAIVGINKMQTKPVWQDTQFVPRQVMNLSSSFDHRLIDGYDAAVFIQAIKVLLENPEDLFIPSP